VIGRLRGVIVERALDGSVVLDVGGVGYEVFVPLGALGRLPANEALTLHVHTHVREDAFTLFGFVTAEDRAAFRTLLGVSSIGPKVALAILGHLDAAQLAQAIARQDKTVLTRIPGVGKKLVERILLELKDKLGFTSAGVASVMTAGGAQVLGGLVPAPAGPLAAAASALMSMGFRPQEAERAVAAVAHGSEGKPLEQLVREALAAVG
jgi:holliday junction DNA helicase RuvA